MSLNIAVQMDPIERINIRGDSTFALLLEAKALGFEDSIHLLDSVGELLGPTVDALVLECEQAIHGIDQAVDGVFEECADTLLCGG